MNALLNKLEKNIDEMLGKEQESCLSRHTETREQQLVRPLIEANTKEIAEPFQEMVIKSNL